MMRAVRSRHGWRAGIGLLALLVVLLAGCSSVSGMGQSPAATATSAPDTADQQDVLEVPPPVPTDTPTPLPTPRPTAPPPPAGVPAPPSDNGKVILVSLSRQQLWTYNNGAYAFTALVETGRPELPTPTGTFHVFLKACSDKRWTNNTAPTTAHNAACTTHVGDGYPFVFTSPWPVGSPYYYYPTHINYALEFESGGFYLHDAWWHVAFGPGANVPHKLADGTWETGSHGCVGMTTANAERLYAWAPTGATVVVRAVA